MSAPMLASDFDFELPSERIAQCSVEPRDHSKLMYVNGTRKTVEHRRFDSIVELINEGDLLVWNNSKVFKARLLGCLLHFEPTGVVKPSPTKLNPVVEDSWEVKRDMEIFLVRPVQPDEVGILDPQVPQHLWRVLGKPTRKMVPGDRVRVVMGFWCQLVAKEETGELIVHFHEGSATSTSPREAGVGLDAGRVRQLCNEHGHIPVPPYVKDEPTDIKDYQTVYAQDSREGSVAAPTAGFHFTPQLIQSLRDKGVRFSEVTLHVGLGTFMPMHSEKVDDHKMHSEQVELTEETIQMIADTKRSGKRVIAVGTTTVRVLEGVAGRHPQGQLLPFFGDVNIFIKPGFHYNVVDALITNFHLPKSTLLMLVSAFARDRLFILDCYRTAVELQYRFFSFGDSMFIVHESS